LNIESTSKEYAFDEADIRLVTSIAGSLSVALENARLFAETKQRASELAIINDVQAGLVAQLDIQDIYQLVGDRVQKIFDAQVVVITRFDVDERVTHYEYVLENGMRYDVEPQPFNKIIETHIRDGQTQLVNTEVAEWLEKGGASVVAGETPLSVLAVPLIIAGKVSGAVSLQNVSREYAFTPSDVQLLQTLAASLNVALENARLFNEIQQSNRQLTEALAEQTATGEILHVMADAPTDVYPVLNAGKSLDR
jgi:GAF domain-containing protein